MPNDDTLKSTYLTVHKKTNKYEQRSCNFMIYGTKEESWYTEEQTELAHLRLMFTSPINLQQNYSEKEDKKLHGDAITFATDYVQFSTNFYLLKSMNTFK